MNTAFFVFEIIGTIAFALSGALVALRSKMDIFGVCVLGMTTAVGGGIIRDLMLGINPPNALRSPIHALIAIGISALTFLPFVQKFLARNKSKFYEVSLLIADSLGLGIFTVIGVNAGFNALQTPNIFLSVFLGVITGVGGGVIRDIMAKTTPKIFVKHFYACAAISGALSCALLRSLCGELWSSVIGAVVVIMLRMLAAKFRWTLPKPKFSFSRED